MRKVLALSICALVFVAGAYAQINVLAWEPFPEPCATLRAPAIPGAQVVVANESKGIRRTLGIPPMQACFSARRWCRARATASRSTRRDSPATRSRHSDAGRPRRKFQGCACRSAGSTIQVSVEAAAPIVDSTKTDVSQVVGANQIQESADQRPPRRLFRAAVSRRRARRHLRPDFLPRHRRRQLLPDRRQRHHRSSTTTRTPAAPASRRRFRRTPCRNSRWFPTTTRPSSATPPAAWSTP